MAESSQIEWTDSTWNPLTGCTMVSAGCSNCYAMRLAGGRMRDHWSRKGLTTDTPNGPVWNGLIKFNEAWLDQPLRWRRPRLIFACAHTDLFHPDVNLEWIDRIWSVMLKANHHRYQVLTKRPERMYRYVRQTIDGRGRVPQHIWLGTSAEDQATAQERIPWLIETPAAVRFASLEPLIGPLDLRQIVANGRVGSALEVGGLNWVIAGGESGPRARPMGLPWARKLRDQCNQAGVAFHFKQWGEWGEWLQLGAGNMQWKQASSMTARLFRVDEPLFGGRWFPTCDLAGSYYVRVGRKAAGRLLDGRTHEELPASL